MERDLTPVITFLLLVGVIGIVVVLFAVYQRRKGQRLQEAAEEWQTIVEEEQEREKQRVFTETEREAERKLSEGHRVREPKVLKEPEPDVMDEK